MTSAHEGIVPADMLLHVPGWEPLYDKGYRWLDYQRNKCDIAQTLAVADLLWPPLIEVEGLILFHGGAGLKQTLKSLRDLYGTDQEVERQYNMQRVVELIHTDTGEQEALAHDDALITTLGEVLQTFWSLRLRLAFPTRRFHIELGEDIGETGLAITFYQNINASLG